MCIHTHQLPFSYLLHKSYQSGQSEGCHVLSTKHVKQANCIMQHHRAAWHTRRKVFPVWTWYNYVVTMISYVSTMLIMISCQCHRDLSLLHFLQFAIFMRSSWPSMHTDESFDITVKIILRSNSWLSYSICSLPHEFTDVQIWLVSVCWKAREHGQFCILGLPAVALLKSPSHDIVTFSLELS